MPLFAHKPSTNEEGLQKAIDAVLHEMQAVRKDSDEYATLLKRLETLYNLKKIDNDDHPKKLSADTALQVAGSLAGILILVGYERAHVMTSKAVSLLVKTPVTK